MMTSKKTENETDDGQARQIRRGRKRAVRGERALNVADRAAERRRASK
jgi:hypothetical protein